MRIKSLIMTLAFSLSAIAQGKSELDVFNPKRSLENFDFLLS